MLGTWSFPSSDEPGGIGYLHFAGDGRVFHFIHHPEQPERRLPMRLWYTFESPYVLRLRDQADESGWVSGYQFDGTALTISNPSRTFLCLRPLPEEIPAWFHEHLTAALAQP